jgi:hypothetical protein
MEIDAMPDDLDFTEEDLMKALLLNSQRTQDALKIMEWMREPDHVSNANFCWMVEWLERRPIAEITRICG